jgi:hypothetical protein
MPAAIYATPALWPDLSKHIAGFYLIDKSSLTKLCMLEGVGVAPKTQLITPACWNHCARIRTS